MKIKLEADIEDCPIIWKNFIKDLAENRNFRYTYQIREVLREEYAADAISLGENGRRGHELIFNDEGRYAIFLLRYS